MEEGLPPVLSGTSLKVLCMLLCKLEKMISPVSGRGATIRSQGILQDVKFVVWSRSSGKSSEWVTGYHQVHRGTISYLPSFGGGGYQRYQPEVLMAKNYSLSA